MPINQPKSTKEQKSTDGNRCLMLFSPTTGQDYWKKR